MKLSYLVLGSNPLRVKFFYNDAGRYGEFYMEFTRETLNANNPEDEIGVRGHAVVDWKRKEYANDLVQGLAEALGASIVVNTTPVKGGDEHGE